MEVGMVYRVVFLTLLWLGVGTTEAAILKLYMTRMGMMHVVEVAGRGGQNLARIQVLLEALQPTDEVEVHTGTVSGPDGVLDVLQRQVDHLHAAQFQQRAPVFDGRGSDIWFKLSADQGVETKLRFRYLKVQNYNTAMIFQGNRNDLSGWNSGNELYGM